MNIAESTNKLIPKKSLIERLFDGEMPLVKTYWVFYFLIGNVVPVIFITVLGHYYYSIVYLHNLVWMVDFLCWVVIGYNCFILIAVWKSAMNYGGLKIWKYLSQFAVIIGFSSIAVNIISENNPHINLNNRIENLNKYLPQMVDEITRLESITEKDNNIYYTYTIIVAQVDQLDINVVQSNLENKINKSICEEKIMLDLLEKGKNLLYIYNDKNGKHITTVIIKQSDCF